MSLTRNFLKSMSLTDEQISSIIEAHTETVDALKAERDKYKADAEKLPEVQKELKTAQDAAKKSGDAEAIQKAFDDFKAEVKAKETKAAKESALRKVAKDAGLTDAGIAKAVKYTDYASIELDDKGDVKDAKTLISSLKAEWPEHIATTSKSGAKSATPPGGDNGGGNKPDYADIRKMTAGWHASKYGGTVPAGNNSNGGENGNPGQGNAN